MRTRRVLASGASHGGEVTEGPREQLAATWDGNWERNKSSVDVFAISCRSHVAHQCQQQRGLGYLLKYTLASLFYFLFIIVCEEWHVYGTVSIQRLQTRCAELLSFCRRDQGIKLGSSHLHQSVFTSWVILQINHTDFKLPVFHKYVSQFPPSLCPLFLSVYLYVCMCVCLLPSFCLSILLVVIFLWVAMTAIQSLEPTDKGTTQ